MSRAPASRSRTRWLRQIAWLEALVAALVLYLRFGGGEGDLVGAAAAAGAVMAGSLLLLAAGVAGLALRQKRREAAWARHVRGQALRAIHRGDPPLTDDGPGPRSTHTYFAVSQAADVPQDLRRRAQELAAEWHWLAAARDPVRIPIARAAVQALLRTGAADPPECLWRLARLDLWERRYHEAEAVLSRLVTEWPATPEGVNAREWLAILGIGLESEARSVGFLAEADRLVLARDYAGAGARLRAVALSGPDALLRDFAWFRLGKFYDWNLHARARASEAFEQCRPDRLPTGLAKAVLHDLARCLLEQGASERALAAVTVLLTAAPDDRRRPAVLLLKGECHARLGQRDEAARAYREVRALDPDGPLGSAARVREASLTSAASEEPVTWLDGNRPMGDSPPVRQT